MSRAAVRRPQESVHNQVLARMSAAIVGGASKVTLEAIVGKKFVSAPLHHPPISSGLTDATDRLREMMIKKSAISRQEYEQVPVLLRRIRHLLRVYYDAQLSGRKTAEFKYCDKENIDEVGLDLRQCGLTLQLTPGRLRALFRYAPAMDAFLFMEPLDLGRWRAEAFARGRVVAADPESTDEDRMAAGALEDRAQADLAAYQMSFFVTDVLVAWLLVSPLDSAEQDRATKAMGRLVEYASSPRYRDVQALGDALTDALRPVYESPDILVRFAHAGGLPALFNDWATSEAKDGYCKSAVRSLPVNAWEHQTPESLLGVMKGLVDKISDAGEEVVATKLFTGVIYRIYSRYGLEPFERASTISDSCILFYFLHRRISRKPAAYRSHDAIRVLLRKYTNIPEAIRRRHGWGILTVSGRWDCLEYYGCVFANCPERTELLELKERRQRGVCNPDAEARLYRWGDESRMCSTCKTVSYCSAACQKADWEFHKSQCKTKDDMETDV